MGLSPNGTRHIPISLFACSHLHMLACAGFHPSHSNMRVRDAYNLICGMFWVPFGDNPTCVTLLDSQNIQKSSHIQHFFYNFIDIAYHKTAVPFHFFGSH